MLKETFRKERRTLLTILVIFDLSYVLRALYDLLFAQYASMPFFLAVSALIIPELFDMIPICLILIYHTKNF